MWYEIITWEIALQLSWPVPSENSFMGWGHWHYRLKKSKRCSLIRSPVNVQWVILHNYQTPSNNHLKTLNPSSGGLVTVTFVISFVHQHFLDGFPDSSVGKESTCNAGDSSSIPGLGRFSGEGTGYPFQYSGLENAMDSPWGRKQSDTTEWLSLFIFWTFFLYLRNCPYFTFLPIVELKAYFFHFTVQQIQGWNLSCTSDTPTWTFERRGSIRQQARCVSEEQRGKGMEPTH